MSMAGDTTTIVAVVSASLGVVGTLAATVLTQRSALRSKQLEADLQRQTIADERAHAARQTAIEDKRVTYAELNSAVRSFRSTAYDHLIAVIEQPTEQHSLVDVEKTRQVYKDRYSRAQMLLTERPMLVAAELNRGISSAYRVLLTLTQHYDPNMAETLRRWFSDGLSDGVWLLREVLRQDLGVVSEVPSFNQLLAKLQNERKTTVETLPGARESRPRP